MLILDISGSMAPYSRALMQFAYAAMAAGRRVEMFVFGTRLTRVTRTLRTKDPDRALHEIGAQVEDWEGGTRIGESLKTLLDGWSQRAALRGAVVVLCSDGLERGDPELLRAQMARLRRLAHRVVWVNPLKGSPRYEPLARGMAAALPSVDVFLSGHNLESLEHLGRRRSARRPRPADGGRLCACVTTTRSSRPTSRSSSSTPDPPRRTVEPRVLAGGRHDRGRGAIVLVVEIFANRPIANTIGHAQHDLRVGAGGGALEISSTSGSFAGANADGSNRQRLDDGRARRGRTRRGLGRGRRGQRVRRRDDVGRGGERAAAAPAST